MPHALTSPATLDTDEFKALPLFQQEWPVFSHSQLSSFASCEFKWYMNYKLGYTAEVKADYFTLGSLVHEALDSLYRHIMEGMSARNWFDNIFPHEIDALIAKDPENIVHIGHATFLMSRYVQEQPTMDVGNKIHESEKYFLVPMESRNGRPFLLQGYVDLITIDHHGNYVIWDHKTGTRHWSPVEVQMDSQLPTYGIALRELGYPIGAYCINFLNTYDYKKREEVLNEKLFKRDIVYKGDTELRSRARNLLTLVDRVLDAYESDDEPLRHLRRDCRMCGFKDPCELSLGGINVTHSLEMSHKKKNNPIATPPEYTGIYLGDS